jgi:hypothetical protein
MRKRVVAGLVFAMLAAGGVALAAKPAENIGKKHPNLAAAQKLCAEAFDKIAAAQKANEYDMENHAQKAKELLEQAGGELKLAAEAANQK